MSLFKKIVSSKKKYYLEVTVHYIISNLPDINQVKFRVRAGKLKKKESPKFPFDKNSSKVLIDYYANLVIGSFVSSFLGNPKK